MRQLKPAILAGFLFFTQLVSGQDNSAIHPGASSTDQYFPLIKNLRVAIVANQTSLIDSVHLLDSLLSSDIRVVKVFSPEHGFRGTNGAGENVKNSTDTSTGIKYISLYGKHFKPKASELSDADVVLFDIQDVGIRFFTYLSTLHYTMEACAENNKKLIILDRPNPNGFYIDGPVLDLKYKSFVGLVPVPIVYGMTIGEYAKMLNGEGWLKNKVQCALIIIPCKGYKHTSRYKLPVRPSPNLPNMQAVYLYPSLALFEGTCINVGRGTNHPFQVFGHPDLRNMAFSYIPRSVSVAKNPLHEDTICYGTDLRAYQFADSSYFTTRWLQDAYDLFPNKDRFFNVFFYNLSGNKLLKEQLKSNIPEKEIKKQWKDDLERFKIIRAKYLIYN